MRRARACCYCFTAVLLAVSPAAAVDRQPAGSGPSLEYRPPRPALPEPKPSTPESPLTIFRETIGGFGIGAGSFDGPVDIAADTAGNFYVLDAGNNRVEMFDSFSNFVLAWGTYGSHSGQFNNPQAIAVDQGGSVYVVDTGNHRIQKFGWVQTASCEDCPERTDGLRLKFIITWGSLGSRSGDFKRPVDITFDGDGNSYVLDADNERVQKFDPGGRFVGEWGRLLSSRGGVFKGLVSLAWSDDRYGYLYLLGAECIVQQFELNGNLVSTWPAVAPESGLCVPGRVESDNENDYIYILDTSNGLARFTRDGRFLAILRGAERPFAKPRGFAVNPVRGEMVVADTGNNSVQKFTLR